MVAALALTGFIAGFGSAPNAGAAISDIPAAIQSGVDDAAGYGITQYVAVVDRSTGQLVGSTANLDIQVGSESVFKLFLAAYLLRQYGGAFPTPAMNSEMWDMIVRSNDGVASKYWSADAVPSMAAAYGLSNTTNPTDRIGHWGAVRITARDMTTFLWRMSQDPLVSSWLLGAMASTSQTGADNEFQGFGFNSLGGSHGSKQGWGCDSFWVGPCAINSVGYTDLVIGAVLQTSDASRYETMKSTSTTTVRSINDAANKVSYRLPGRDNPEGSFAASVGRDGVVQINGWAFDGSDLLVGTDVFINTNGQSSLQLNATGPRPELTRFGIAGNHGFKGSFRLPGTGPNQLCMYVRNIGAGADQLVQCLNVNFAVDPLRDNPRGALSATVSASGNISMNGWGFDPNDPAVPVNIMLTVNGQLVSLAAANGARPELANFGIPGNHGFSARVAAAATGSQRVCLYVANLGWGTGQWVQCVTLNFAPDPVSINPRGAFAVTQSGNKISVNGWAFDPSALAAPITVMLTVNGEVRTFALAQGPRPELASFGVPGNHGFVSSTAGTAGADQVCLFVFNIGYGTNQLVGCRSV